MKKIVSVILAFVLLASCSALAEITKGEGDFSIRGGITFGMDLETVKGIEDAKLTEEKDKDGYHILGYLVEDSLAGIPLRYAGNDPVRYYFSLNEKKLESIEYYFGENGSYLEELCSMITDKYGNPLHYNDGGSFPRFTPIVEKYLGYISQGHPIRLTSFVDWVVEYEKYYVLINAFTYTSGSGEHLYLAYKAISNEEMATIVNDALHEEQEKENQRKNDI